MTTRTATIPLEEHRARLLEGVPLTECRITVAGLPTAVLEGGEGPPVVLLHGPGESAVNWRWVVPDLARTHRVVAPDLPAHGATGTDPACLGEDGVLAWLHDLVEQRCAEPPALVGHVLGGAIAARFAARHPDRVSRLVLVDSLGLSRFRPSMRFALGFVGFLARPNERSFERFMGQCAYDLDRLRRDMGHDWQPFAAYNIGLARAANAKDGGRLFRSVGLPRLPTEDLGRISAPTTLVWGRGDRALKLKIAERASRRHGWRLEVIDGAADDPPRDQPEAFVGALRRALDAAPGRNP
jgi:pimeloyl-ACP methyl ester carboxylesterase